MLHPFANDSGSDAAITSCALTHAGVLNNSVFAERYSVALPAQSALGNPSTLSVCGGNPDLNAGATVFNLQAPLGLEFGNLAVLDDSSLEWVDDNKVSFAKHQLWFYPKKVSQAGNDHSDHEINHLVTGNSWVENRLDHKKRIQCECQNSPNQIALWAKNCIHASIIAGNPAVGRGK